MGLSAVNSPGTALLDMQRPEGLYKKAMLLQKRKDSDERIYASKEIPSHLDCSEEIARTHTHERSPRMRIDDIMEEVNLNLADAEADQSFERRKTLYRKEP